MVHHFPSRRRAVAASIIVGAAIVASPLPAGAQAPPPPLTAGPSPAAPGSTITIQVTCPTKPDVELHPEYDDIVAIIDMAPGSTPGTWTYTDTIDQDDWTISATCEGSAAATTVVDAETPGRLFFGGTGGLLPPDAVPTQIIRKDCPVGSTATVTYQVGDAAPVQVTGVATEPDGDVVFDLPPLGDAQPISASIACGSIDTLPAIVWRPGTAHTLPPTTTSAGPTTTTTTAPVVSSNPQPGPAIPVPAGHSFTG
jgi:hypothetical protein